jgi:hypothetical protein
MSEDWVEVSNVKKLRYQNSKVRRQEEYERWKELKSQIPWIVDPSRARKIRQKLNIEHLDEKLLSDVWIQYQREGWNYVRVVRPNDTQTLPINPNIEFSLQEVGNKWGDKVLFVRHISGEPRTVMFREPSLSKE